MDAKVSYIRQSELFNPVNQKFNIVILGAGSLGSFIALNLAKLGFNNISIYDFDTVAAHNIPNQFYRVKDIGKPKVEALLEIVRDFADVELDIYNEKLTPKTKLPLGMDNLFIVTFDSLKERRKVFDILKETGNCYAMDVRCGGEEYNIQTVNLFNEDEITEWGKSFDLIPAKLPCGAKSICYTNLSVASEVCNIAKKINNGENYPSRLIRHMKAYRIINDLNNGVVKK